MNIKRQIQDWKTHTDIVYVFEEDGKIAGYAKLTFHTGAERELIISHVYVLEAFRGMKYGNLIMATLEEAARDEFNAAIIYLWVERETFMYDWYRSRNYNFHKPFTEAPNTDWLKRKV